jgi:nicotinamidase-related amidase
MIIDTDDFHMKTIQVGARLDASKSALVIIDMMNRFCDAKWLANGDENKEQWFEDGLDKIIPNLQLVLEDFRACGGLVVHVVNAKWTESGRDVVPYQRGRDYELFDSQPMSVIKPLAPKQGEVVIRKVASSAFTGTGLEFILRNAGIESVILGGQYGGACVLYSLIQSRELGFENYWMGDAILYGSEKNQGMIQSLVGSQWATMASAKDVVHALS